MKFLRKNPFRLSFISVVLICCFALSAVFYYISYRNYITTNQAYAREKAEQIMQEVEIQLRAMEDIALRISSSNEYQPRYFREDVVKELDMLESFQQTAYYSVLSQEYFLDFGTGRFYLSSGRTMLDDLYPRAKSEKAEEWHRFREEVQRTRDGLTNICGKPRMCVLFGKIYILTAFRTQLEDGTQGVAVLGSEVELSTLEERFRIVSGGLQGEMSLYSEGDILYSNRLEPVAVEENNVIVISSKDGQYTFCCIPKDDTNVFYSMLVMQLPLILVDILLLFLVGSLFAEKSYKPLRTLAQRYHMDEEACSIQGNALDEIRNMMERLLQSNSEVSLQLQESQKLLRNQVLQMIMEGSIFLDSQIVLERAQVNLPGPYYCVVSISFEGEENVTIAFLENLQNELEKISDVDSNEYVYAIYKWDKKLLNVMCSAQTKSGSDDIIEVIHEVVGGFGCQSVVGTGNIYQSYSKIAASFLESMDEIQHRRGEKVQESYQKETYSSKKLRRILAALENGSEEAALKGLEQLMSELGDNITSMLMLQHILVDFYGEVGKLGERYQFEMDKQKVSLLVSAKNQQDFEFAMKKVISEFCEKYAKQKVQSKEDASLKICKYVEEHFTECDISNESVAEHFEISTDAVRQAILAHTGKLFREYVICLRVEYAKELLQKEDMPLVELGQKIGYHNVSYFIKQFKEYVGMTPSNYRKNARG